MRLLNIVAAMAALVTLSLCAVDGDALKNTVKQLTAGKTARLDKAAAIHAFVRDQVKEVAATYT